MSSRVNSSCSFYRVLVDFLSSMALFGRVFFVFPESEMTTKARHPKDLASGDELASWGLTAGTRCVLQPHGCPV